MTFLLDSLKKFGTEDEEEGEGFSDLNFAVGNTSGMDVTQQIPSELAERVGYAAQRGGSSMEVKVSNPTSFFIDREDLLQVVDGLGIDMTIHSDPNIGYTSAYREGQGRGFDPTHDYFKKYLETFAHFKEEAVKREDFNFTDTAEEGKIRIGRINPHISTDGIPALDERMPQDVGLDPFGYDISEFKDDIWKTKSKNNVNIFKNKKFLRRFYRLFVVDEIGDNEYRYFSNFYTSFSNHFDLKWREFQNDILREIYENRTGSNGGSKLKDKIDILSTASMRENVATRWLEIISDKELDNPVEVDIDIDDQLLDRLPDEIKTLEDLDKLISSLSQRYRLSQLRSLPEIYYFLKNQEMDRLADITENNIDQDFQEELWTEIQESHALSEALDDLWKSDPREDNEDIKTSLISVQGKIQAVVRELEIPETRVPEKAFEKYDKELREEIEKMFAGEDLKKYFSENEDNEDEEIWERRHRRFLQAFARNFEQQMWQESSLFYKIIPAWMDVAHETYEEGHKGWKAPKFLWEHLVARKWKDKEGVELDLANPRSDNGDDVDRYFDLLENNNEFQMDVAAAVGAVYIWSHFTQIEDNFQKDPNEYVEKDYGDYTWIEWMNKYNIGINMEAMNGSAQQLFKVWRPVHMVAACRAVNITARNELGRQNISDVLDECPLKFTIDMEHVASFGVNPLQEIENLAEREKELLENPIEIDGEEVYTPGDPDKPLAKMVRMYHLTKPGHETQQGVGHTHGPFRKGDVELYGWLYKMVKYGFGRCDTEMADVMYELGGEMAGTVYQAKLAMNLIELGVSDKELDPSKVDPGKNYDTRKEALMARFFNMDKSHYSQEWAKIENNAFAPLEGLMEAKTFDKTTSGTAALEQGELRPQELPQEEYK